MGGERHCKNPCLQLTLVFQLYSIVSPPPGDIPCNGLYEEARPVRTTFCGFHKYERVGQSTFRCNVNWNWIDDIYVLVDISCNAWCSPVLCMLFYLLILSVKVSAWECAFSTQRTYCWNKLNQLIYKAIMKIQWVPRFVGWNVIWLWAFPNSSIIHQVKTKEITTVKEVWIPDLN